MFGQPMPMPFSFPVVWSGAPSQVHSPAVANVSPARVKTALEYLQQVMIKQMPRAAVNDISIEWAEKIDLVTAERNAVAAAANLLADYFAGKTEPDLWEQQRFDAVKQITADAQGRSGTLLRCPACAPGTRGRPDCPLCQGHNQVIIYPRPQGTDD